MTPDCGKTLGYVLIKSQADLDAISSCATINGDLLLPSAVMNSISFSPKLKAVMGAMVIAGGSGSGTTTIQAPGLTSVGSGGGFSSVIGTNYRPGLTIQSFPLLNSMSFNELDAIGGSLVFNNNPLITNFNGFQSLITVGGDVDIIGNFTSLSLPSLDSIGGGINIETTSNSFQCPFPNFRTDGHIHGTGFVCSGNIANPQSNVHENVTANTQPFQQSGSSKIQGFG
jgi:hypothetical protein